MLRSQMFDVGFTELLLVFVIGLLILGPERLPRVAAQLGRWVGRARRTANQLRQQLEREIALDEIHRTQKSRPKPEPGKPPGDEAAAVWPPPQKAAAEAGSPEPESSPASPEAQSGPTSETASPPQPSGAPQPSSAPPGTQGTTAPEAASEPAGRRSASSKQGTPQGTPQDPSSTEARPQTATGGVTPATSGAREKESASAKESVTAE